MPVPNYFVGYQLRLYFLVAIVTAIAHFSGRNIVIGWREPKAIDACESIPEAPMGPKPYMIFPLLPLCFILGFSQYGFTWGEDECNFAMMLAFGIAFIS